ncbi:hypothetical protein RFI_26080 [Reticulomyxa filosa]|uniref:Uncharacterized protein n=1 Tax=Reticulomyxa filosa TaxID=46433 RepID=X6MCX0_RETFI|nr:hypothetical protein RFI_26080 [Reticulomyxa filosa]|eukprot:ETO11297.1 hypothetical protein RFI_26080 [Reticulomyxa filosa]
MLGRPNMPLKTRVTEILGIEHPIVCGGMHYVGYASLAAAVSEAGGLGVITALTQKSSEGLRKEIQKAKSLTKKPLGVNMTLLPGKKKKKKRKEKKGKRKTLAPPDYQSYAQVIIDEGIRIVETAGRAPDKFIKFFKSHGCVVIHKCVAVKHALHAEKLGVDIISMDGYECAGLNVCPVSKIFVCMILYASTTHKKKKKNNLAPIKGHPGEEEVGNFVLLPVAAKQLKIPFIASGGVGYCLFIHLFIFICLIFEFNKSICFKTKIY